MNDERRAGEALSRLAFGLGAKKTRKPPLTVPDVLTPEQPGAGVKVRRIGMGACSCTRRKQVT